jgi:hypothetical protein
MYIISNKVVLDQYIHFNIVYFEHNGEDETCDSIVEVTKQQIYKITEVSKLTQMCISNVRYTNTAYTHWTILTYFY